MFDTNLPQPNDSFGWVQVAGRPALVCRALEPFARHMWTTRSWQLGDKTREPEAAWREVAAAAGTGLIRVQQVHGADVFVHRAGNPPPSGTADIIVGNDNSAALTIQTADCVPILIVDRRTGVVAAAHAGWRGLAAGVPRVAVEALAREFGSRPADLLAAAGPSIGACCYEVGEEVHQRFLQRGWRTTGSWFFETPQPSSRNPSMSGVGRATRAGHWYFDSAAAARDQLEAAGLLREQVFIAGLCTASHPGVFCSYRRDGAPAGRMAATITFAPPHRP